MDKASVMKELLARLTAELDTMTAAQQNTARGVTHEESRAENDKDTRGLESSYLARGQAERVLDLRDGLAKLRGVSLRVFADGTPIALGAVVVVACDDVERVYFLAPAGGGELLRVGGEEIRVVTPSSPVGRALLGRTTGEDVPLRTPQGAADWTIVRMG